jgi:hypothetical protein
MKGVIFCTAKVTYANTLQLLEVPSAAAASVRIVVSLVNKSSPVEIHMCCKASA